MLAQGSRQQTMPLGRCTTNGLNFQSELGISDELLVGYAHHQVEFGKMPSLLNHVQGWVPVAEQLHAP
eukprot:1150687-Pelagomonas_calceolata.AAC.3